MPRFFLSFLALSILLFGLGSCTAAGKGDMSDPLPSDISSKALAECFDYVAYSDVASDDPAQSDYRNVLSLLSGLYKSDSSSIGLFETGMLQAIFVPITTTDDSKYTQIKSRIRTLNEKLVHQQSDYTFFPYRSSAEPFKNLCSLRAKLIKNKKVFPWVDIEQPGIVFFYTDNKSLINEYTSKYPGKVIAQYWPQPRTFDVKVFRDNSTIPD